jgi:hypothetical protein
MKAISILAVLLLCLAGLNGSMAQSAETEGEGGNMEFGTNFWWIAWGHADPFKDAYDNVTGQDPWKAEWVEEIKNSPYTALRMMDWNQTNSAQRKHPGLRWSERRKKGDRVQQPVAYEWQVDFCNKTGKDLWLCVPHFAGEDEEYLMNLARLVHEQLNPGLNVYLEYSNEVWNAGMFDQGKFSNQRGLEMGLDKNEYAAGQKYLVHCSVRIWRAFENVFGDDSERLVRILSGQRGGGQLKPQLDALRDEQINPSGMDFDAWATNAYFGHHTESWEELEAALDQTVQKIARLRERVPEHVALVCYEGGQHIWDKRFAHEWNSDPRMYDLYIDFFDKVSPHFELFMHYVHVGTGGPNSGNQWGAKMRMNQPLSEAHKWRAILDWRRQHGRDE